MSGYDVLMFVGATTLVAAIVTLLAFQMTAAKLERKMNRRSRTLEGPVPGRQSLSTIGLNTETARGVPRSSGIPARQLAIPMGPPKDTEQQLGPSTLRASSTPAPAKDAKLNSAQTIRARSASLHTDAQPDQSTGPKPLTPAGTPPIQRPPKRPVSETEQEQGPATPHAKSRPEKAAGADSISPSSAPAAETAEPTIAPKTHTPKRAKRTSAQASTDTIPSLDLLSALQPETGGSFSGDGDLPDIFAGLNEAAAGIQGPADDLSDIDGGGLPTTTAPKTPQKSRR